MMMKDADDNTTTSSESRNKAGLEFDPSVPDPLRYTGGNFVSLADLVDEDAWKSTNKNDAFKFESTKNFDGSLTISAPPDSEDGTTPPPPAKPSISIIGKSRATSDFAFAKLVSRKTDYQLKLKFSTTLSFNVDVNINIRGSDETAFFGTFQKKTGEQNLDNVDANTVLMFETLDDVGNITGATVRLKVPEATATEIPDILTVEVAKRDRQGSFGPFVQIELQKITTGSGVEYSGSVPVSDPKDEDIEDEAVSEDEETFGSSFEDNLTPPSSIGPSNAFGFYQKTYDSASFEVLLKGSDLIQQNASDQSSDIEFPPSYGLLAREPASADADETALLSKSFCLFVEPRRLLGSPSDRTFVIYTSKNGEEKKNEFEVTSVSATDEFKITRENGGVFKGYFNGVLIGKETLKSSIDEFNEKLLQDQAEERKRLAERAKNTGDDPDDDEPVSRLGEKKKVNSFQLGVVMFAPPPVKNGEQVIRISSKVQFLEPKILLKDRLFSAIEVYNLSLFYGRYGLGRTINTFTLLPGESTEIEFTSSRSSRQSTEQATNIFEKVDTSSKSELERSVEQENSTSSEESSAQSASVSATASGGAFGFSFSATASASTSQSASKSELARSVSSAVANQASEYSSERSIEANTTTSTETQEEETNALKRKLENLNNNRTLNFVFRQLNQEFISILHLVNIRLGFFGADDNIRVVGVDGAKAFIDTYVRADLVDSVYNRFIQKIRFVDNYKDFRKDVLRINSAPNVNEPFKTINLRDPERGETLTPNKLGEAEEEETIVFNKDLEEEFSIADDLEPITGIKGVIIGADRYVVRTEGVATVAILGDGDALDDYGISLQNEDIKEKQAKTRILQAKGDLLFLQKEIMNATDHEDVRIEYLKNFNFLEDGGNQGNSISIENDSNSLFWLWFSKVWTLPVSRAAVALCFLVLLFLLFQNKITLSRLESSI